MSLSDLQNELYNSRVIPHDELMCLAAEFIESMVSPDT